MKSNTVSPSNPNHDDLTAAVIAMVATAPSSTAIRIAVSRRLSCRSQPTPLPSSLPSGAPTPLRRRDTSNDLKVATIQKTPEGVPTRLASFRRKTPDEVKAESEAKEARALERRMTLRDARAELLCASPFAALGDGL